MNRRKVAAMGGMSAQIPIKGDEKANEIAMNKVRADKLREVTYGHDGKLNSTTYFEVENLSFNRNLDCSSSYQRDCEKSLRRAHVRP